VGEASAVLVPALAVDRRGTRLGRGAGFYDRTLQWAATMAPLVAIVRDDELVEELPNDPHDVRMTHAATPGLGVLDLRRE
ncbi:5-formyltetrahydrofolate cyclo-ligase, partial [uncultured Bradyrhizobium sp.]|uniref:5-formyltetrahydrofolate cyclo-ligase n=1 Tax=uncultured Bradyrhizobium sp. TaxID=199684 RepID=UPI0026172048